MKLSLKNIWSVSMMPVSAWQRRYLAWQDSLPGAQCPVCKREATKAAFLKIFRVY